VIISSALFTYGLQTVAIKHLASAHKENVGLGFTANKSQPEPTLPGINLIRPIAATSTFQIPGNKISV